ncbi:MFS transporter [Aureimonas flava]|nr:MFS transporter [Aureimonas flava]
MTLHLGSHPDRRDLAAVRSIMPLVLAIGIIASGNALLATTTSLSLALGHDSVEAVRVALTGYPLGFLIGCLTARSLISRNGHGRTFQGMAVLMACATALFFVVPDAMAWGALRLVNGFAMACAFTVAESWINLESGPRNRGSLLALYMVMSTLGMASGQSLINLGQPGDARLFIVAAAICLAAALPFAMHRRYHPAGRTHSAAGGAGEPDEQVSLATLLRTVPAVVVAAFQAGMANMNFAVLAPIYAAHTGHSAAVAAALVTCYSLGGFLIQLPMGWLSDRFDRSLILSGAAMTATASCLAIALFGGVSTPLLFALLLVYGAAGSVVYPVAIALAGQRFESRHIVSVSGRLLLVYAVGAVVAPAVCNELMARFEPGALFLLLGAAFLATALSSLAERMVGQRRARA